MKLFNAKKTPLLRNSSLLSMKRSDFAVFIAYVILTIIFTYPVFFSGTQIPGGGDAYFYLWDLWWFRKALLNFSNPYFTPYLFHPTGLNLAFSAVTPSNTLLSIPLQPIFGLTRTYNILFLISFIIAGYGTYKLTRYLTGNSQAAFIAGLIFMFSPYHFAHSLGHLNLMSIEWIPFYVLYFLKTVNEKYFKNAIYSAFFLLLVALSEYTYLVYLLAFTVIFLLYHTFVNKKYLINSDLIKRLFIMGAVFGSFFFPFAYPMLKELATSKSNYMYSGGFVTYSADLLGFFLPSELHPILGHFSSQFYKNFTGNSAEYTVFAGYTVLTLAAIAFLKVKTKEVKFWAISTIIFIIFSLGPVLHINGIFRGTIEGINFAIPLPYAMIMNIPIISIARVPSRWDALIMLNLSVLAAYGLSYIFSKFEKRTFGKISKNNCFTIIFMVLILFEFLAIPLPMASANVPQFYNSLNDSEDFAIFEIPDFGFHLAFPEYMYYQTSHEKKIITGYTHVPESCMVFTENTPLINNLYFMYNSPKQIQTINNDILNQDIKEIGPSILNYYNIKYIILHENYMTEEQLKIAKSLLTESIDDKPIYYKNDSMSVYHVKSLPIKSFQLLGDGWGKLEEWNGTPTRWISSNSSLFVYSDENYIAKLCFNTVSFYCTNNMSIYNENSIISNVEVTPTFINIEIPVKLHKGENSIRFHVLESQRPCDIPTLNSTDSRKLGVAIQNITIANKIKT
jgi:hypothetical protein